MAGPAIPIAARLIGTAATRAGGRAATKGAANATTRTAANSVAKRSASNIARQGGTARLITPKKVPTRVGSPAISRQLAHSSRPLSLKPLQNHLPTGKQMQEFCSKAYQRADQAGLVDLSIDVGAELAAQSLMQKMIQHNQHSAALDSSINELNLPSLPQQPDEASVPASNTMSSIDFSNSFADSAASVLGQINDLLKQYDALSSQAREEQSQAGSLHNSDTAHLNSSDFSEPTIRLDENGLRR